MRRFFFLPSMVPYGMIAALVYAFLYFDLFWQITVILACLLISLVFRKAAVPYRDTLKTDGEIYLSPVHGTVEAIRQGIDTPDFPTPRHEVRISMSLLDEKGLYLPTSGEVSYLKANKGRKVSRYAGTTEFYGSPAELSHTDFVLTSKDQTNTLIRFIDSPRGNRPVLYMKSGDRGRGAACFGYYPFGGTLIIYLPASSDILVFPKERLVPGQSVIAALK